MTNWVDFLFVGVILSVLAGVAYAFVAVSSKIQDGVKNTKASLNDRGVNLSANGMSVKTDKHMDREEYLDMTSRGAINVMKAASFGSPESRQSIDLDKHKHEARQQPPEPTTAAKKRSIFGKKK